MGSFALNHVGMTRLTGAHWRRTSDAWKNWRDSGGALSPRSRRRGVWWRRRFRARAGDEPGWRYGRRDLDPKLHPAEPADPGEHQRGLWRQLSWTPSTRSWCTTTPTRRLPSSTSPQSIETKDNQTFTVKLKPGYKFHDGTEVKAKNFVDAWNWNAYGPNGNLNAYFFEPIAGYDDLQCGTDAAGDADCEGKPAKAKEMSGLKVVDDHTFTIKTTDKVSNLPVRLGYIGLRAAAGLVLHRPEGVRREADRRRTVQGGQQDQDTEMVISKFADYSGKYKPNVDKVTFRIYQDDGAAYNDVVANNLDFTDDIPTDRLIDDLYKPELPDRNGVQRRPARSRPLPSRPSRRQLQGHPDRARPSRWRSTGT